MNFLKDVIKSYLKTIIVTGILLIGTLGIWYIIKLVRKKD